MGEPHQRLVAASGLLPSWRGFKSLGPWQENMTAAHAAKAKSDKMSPEEINKLTWKQIEI